MILIQIQEETHRAEKTGGGLIRGVIYLDKEFMKILKNVFCTFFCLLQFNLLAENKDNIGRLYHDCINRGSVSYYINHNIDSAIFYYHKAFSVNKPFYQDYFRFARIWNFEKKFDSVFFYLVKSIEIGCPELLYKEIVNEEPFNNTEQAKMFKSNLNTYRSKFLLELNFEFTRFIHILLGKDQAIRLELSKDINKDKNNLDLGNRIDKANREELLEYFKIHGFPDLRKIDYSTQNVLSVFLNHYVIHDTNLVFTDTLFLVFKEQFERGNMLPHIIITPIDYNYMIFRKQIFGIYSTSLVENSQKVDSLNYEFGILNIQTRNRIEKLTKKPISN